MISTWQSQRLIRIHIGIALVILFWNISLTATWIEWIDRQAAYFFNDLVRQNIFCQNFWAYFASHGADWLLDGVMFLFAAAYILPKGVKSRKRRLIECLFLVAFSFAYFHLFHQGFIKKLTRPIRLSPTGVLPNMFHLSEVISWTDVKIFSRHCYPSDHGTTVCTFIMATFALGGRKKGLLAILFASPFVIARLITGAHWVSDVLLGSLLLVLFNFAWLFYTPAFARTTQYLSREGALVK